MMTRRTQNIPESQRGTEQVKLRLSPELVEAMDEMRGEQGRSSWVGQWIRGKARRLGVLGGERVGNASRGLTKSLKKKG